jgi:hypothetical protein
MSVFYFLMGLLCVIPGIIVFFDGVHSSNYYVGLMITGGLFIVASAIARLGDKIMLAIRNQSHETDETDKTESNKDG